MSKPAIRIGIIGPESTGKTLLAQKLTEYYNGEWIPEYARTYMENLNRPYEYQDVKNIAQWLIDAYNNRKKQPHPVFFDTEMIITKVWFDVAFGKIPHEMDKWLNNMDFDAFLLCYYDLPWIPDPVRENGGKMREILFNRYEQEIRQLKKPYAIIRGKGINRILNAAQALSRLISLPDITNAIQKNEQEINQQFPNH